MLIQKNIVEKLSSPKFDGRNASLVLLAIDNIAEIKKVHNEIKIKSFITLVLKYALKSFLKDDKILCIQDGLYGFMLNNKNLTKNVEVIYEKITNLTYRVNNNYVLLECTMGISFINKIVKSPFEDAYSALTEAKQKQKQYSFLKNYKKRTMCASDANAAVKESLMKDRQLSCLIPFFQPIVDYEKNEIVKYEILARLRINDKIIKPFAFIDLAKELKLKNKILLKMIDCAIMASKENNASFSINISLPSILNRKIRREIYAKLESCPEIAKKLTFEILEDYSSGRNLVVENFISTVQALRSNIAIDDFGAGEANFLRLANFNVNCIKIDGSMIKNIEKPQVLSIIKLIVSFAEEHGKNIIAEFVENEKLAEKLYSIGIRYMQGYYFSKPLCYEDTFS